MEKFFGLKKNNTNVSTEIMAGVTTFFAMSYILFVNPTILSASGMPFQAVFLATIIASIIGTLVMGLFANVPYAQAPGMGLNAFFTFTVVFGLGYSWQQALAMVFICGLINIFITVTRVRKKGWYFDSRRLQHAIGGGIGIFVAYVGIKNAGFLSFSADQSAISSSVVEGGKATNVTINGGIVPALANFDNAPILLAVIGLVLTAILVVKNVRGAILIGIVATTGIDLPNESPGISRSDWQTNSLGNSFKELGTTFGAAFGSEGMQSLFSDSSKIPQVLMTIIAFGKRVQPHLVKAIYGNDENGNLGEVKKEIGTTVENTVNISAENMAILREGFHHIGRNLASPKGLVYDKIVLSRIKALSIKERSKCHVRKKT
ncbi:hypothetical protein EfmJHP35_10750 [Enterococcus faecium]|nr:hypothetical protein EfmJHP35_10750 [Enterococcus faecium]